MSSPVPPSSYLEPALSFPKNTSSSRIPSHSPSASSSAELASAPSLYVTFKVLQLVNQFRKRVQTRVRSTGGRSTKQTSSRLTEDFCQAFEREAAQHIDYVLGKTPLGPSRKTPYPDRARKSLHKRKVSKRCARPAAAAKPESDSAAAKKIEWLLRALDKSVKSETHSFSALAKSHELFVERKEDLQIKHDSWKELLPQLVRVTNLLDTLRRAPSSRAGVKTFAESDEGVDFSFDENIVANLEHLLLCLKEQLIRLLIAELRELVRTHVIECQRDQKQHTKELVLEFPDGRHPLSTTWPWSIRPSLAVIWGVCWMFYTYFDHQGNMRDHQGRLVYSAEAHQTDQWDVDPSQTTHQPDLYPTEDLSQFQGQQAPTQQEFYQGDTFRQDFSPQRSPSDQRMARAMLPAHHSPVMGLSMAQPHAHFGGQNVATSHPHFAAQRAPDQQAAHAAAGPTGFHTNNAFGAAPPASYAPPAPPAAVSDSLPQEPYHFIDFQPSPAPYGADPNGPWLSPSAVSRQQQPNNYFAHSISPPQAGIPAPQNLRLETSNFAGFEPHQPQEYISPTPVSATSSNPGQSYGRFLSPQDVRPPRQPQMTSVEHPDQPYTPKSESPVPQALLAHQHSRKRSHDAMNEGGQGPVHSRNGSRAGSEGYQHNAPSGEDESPGRQRSSTVVQRPDPPTNKDGKYVCNYSAECEGQTFDRKCEWNKHMDKHDRPYRCSHPDCAKLQGFTYSGGLLRHEREVHGKHGGPKTPLMCTYPDCKRKNKGFTRKENLNEHIRRVHSKESQPSSMKREGTDANTMGGALPEDAETPASRYSESGLDHDDSLASPTHQPKRRRLNSSLNEPINTEALLRENQDLRSDVARLAAQVQELQALMQTFQQPPQSQQGAPGHT